MAEQKSRLEIVIDSSKAKKDVESVEKSLKDVEKQGDKTEKSVKGTSKAFTETGNSASTASKQLGDFRVKLSEAANEGKFGAGIQSISSRLSSLGSTAALTAGALAGLAVGGTVVAVAGLSAMAIETAKANVELARFAAISNTSIESFQGLGYAAQSYGVTQEQLSDMLKDFNEKIGDFASTGGGEAADFFEKIAVKTEGGAAGAKKLVDEMSKMDGVTGLQTYVDKLEEAGVNQQQMSFYLESMGNDLTKLAPLLMNGGELWKNYQKALVDAGIITGQEAIEKSMLLAAQTESLQLQYASLRNELATAVMPSLSTLINYFLEGSAKGGQFAGIIEAVGYAAQGTAILIIGLATGIQNLVALMKGAVDQMKNIGQTAVEFATADGILGKGRALFNGVSRSFSIAGNTITKVTTNSTMAFNAMGKVVDGTTGRTDALTAAILANSKAQLQMNKNAKKVGLTSGVADNKALNPTIKKGKAPRVSNEANRLKNEAERLAKDLAKKRLDISRSYFTEEEKLAAENADAIKAINEAYATDETNRNKYLKLQAEAYAKDLAEFKKREEEKKRAAWQGTQTPVGNMVGIQVAALSKSRLSSLSQAKFNQNAQQQDGYSQLGDELNTGVNAINTNEYMNQQEKNEALLSLHKQYLDSKKALDEQYAKEDEELKDQNNAATLAGYGAMFGIMSSMLDNFGAKSSGAYKTAFALQKGFVLASALLNAKGAILSEWNNPTNVTIWQKMAAAASVAVQTNELMSAIQGVALSGFANGGYTGHGGKYDPAGIVHKGEGVLTQEEVKALGGPQGFEDLRKSIRRGYATGGLVADTHRVGMGAVSAINSGGGNVGGSSGDVKISQSITFADGSAKVDTQGQKEIAQSLNNMMDAWARRESRQGGVLHKLARG
ncbi:phage tail tape measure protein [Acinetobacter junii]|uniref:phage tail tape measure protein n=1 Tax=Acinetobacter junii TaxID=40215 RepID=UPI0032B4B934